MRRLLVAATAGAVLLGIQAAPASAQIVTIDPAEITQPISRCTRSSKNIRCYRACLDRCCGP